MKLSLKVTAEGVESKGQWSLLKLLECDELPGYVFSRPLPPGEVEAMFQG
jgi:EAL domain-containing protein (putative c-di-GMP-specific phosphodiesterase class I)